MNAYQRDYIARRLMIFLIWEPCRSPHDYYIVTEKRGAPSFLFYLTVRLGGLFLYKTVYQTVTNKRAYTYPFTIISTCLLVIGH